MSFEYNTNLYGKIPADFNTNFGASSSVENNFSTSPIFNFTQNPFLNNNFTGANFNFDFFNFNTFSFNFPLFPNSKPLSCLERTTQFEPFKIKRKGKKGGGHKPLSPTTLKLIDNLAQKLKFDPKDLIAIIRAESGGNPQAVNEDGGATGLIQFMPKTARGLGTSTEELFNMTAEEQMVYVEKFLTGAKRIAGFPNDKQLSGGELYAIIFMPGKVKNGSLCKRGELAYKKNPHDMNNDGVITKSDMEQRVVNLRNKYKV